MIVLIIPEKPKITKFTGRAKFCYTGDTMDLECLATDTNDPALAFSWNSDSGMYTVSNKASVSWKAPLSAGVYKVQCTVSNSFGLSSDTSLYILVKPKNIGDQMPLIYYPFDNDTRDYSGNHYDAILNGAIPTTDALNRQHSAYKFSSGSEIIYTPNSTALNFQDKITISFWVEADQITEESFVVSHGSWEERYKVSITPDRKLRWTVKTDKGTRDLDNTVALALTTFYHFTVTYTGYSMEIYINGDLDDFIPMNGKIQQTSKDLTIGRKDRPVTTYHMNGTIDEVRIYNAELSLPQIKTLPSLWNTLTGVTNATLHEISVYPNPSSGKINLTLSHGELPTSIEAFDMTGRKLTDFRIEPSGPNNIIIDFTNSYRGFVLFRIKYVTGIDFFKILFQR